jgi:hypothetical protein
MRHRIAPEEKKSWPRYTSMIQSVATQHHVKLGHGDANEGRSSTRRHARKRQERPKKSPDQSAQTHTLHGFQDLNYLPHSKRKAKYFYLAIYIRLVPLVTSIIHLIMADTESIANQLIIRQFKQSVSDSNRTKSAPACK